MHDRVKVWPQVITSREIQVAIILSEVSGNLFLYVMFVLIAC